MTTNDELCIGRSLSRREVVRGGAAVAATVLLAGLGVPRAAMAAASAPAVRFADIDGGTHDLGAWRGRPVLVVNTASRCGFTPQYEGLQAVWEKYRDRGLIVLAVPSDDFRQELDSAAEVKEFCEVNFGLDLPMTEITHVRGPQAHPFYRWLAETRGWEPSWNFNKVLLAPDGTVVGTWGSTTRPESRPIRRAIEQALARS